MLATQTPFTALVKEEARYTPGNNSLLEIKPMPLDEVFNPIFSVLAFNVSLQGSVLFYLDLGSKFTTTSLFIIIWREQ